MTGLGNKLSSFKFKSKALHRLRGEFLQGLDPRVNCSNREHSDIKPYAPDSMHLIFPVSVNQLLKMYASSYLGNFEVIQTYS